jgi:hypothetical protein
MGGQLHYWLRSNPEAVHWVKSVYRNIYTILEA